MLNFFKIDLKKDDLKSDFDDELLDLKDLTINRVRVYVTILLVFLILIWMSIFELDIASHSMGEVIPATQIKPVQHLEGGIVRKIFVKEGQNVKANETLIELEKVSSQSDLAFIESQIINLKIKKARLTSQLENKKNLEINEEIKLEYSKKVNAANEILKSYNNKVTTLVRTQKFKIAQQKEQLNESVVRNKGFRDKLFIVNKQLKINAKLMKKGLANEYERLNLLKEKKGITSSIAETKALIRKIKTILSQENSKMENLLVTEKETLKLEIEESDNKLLELKEEILKYKDKDKRLLITSPIDGTILNLNVFSEGAVVNPGGTILSLVPSEDPLLIETKLEVGDVGLIKIGDNVKLQLISSSARGFQPILGKVTYISADKIINNENITYYIVRIKPLESFFTRGNVKFPLIPGVKIQSSILIGKRTILDYLLTPFQDISNNALSET
ncbi:HlyD family type I secretion periplasmic adaptor subunit [Arcobacter peruensis]|uniref:HlyD family type I secretion periplasmic adaptor subunit n=1 Tax=Arcobacter peruensis TaxID=2320140 RepID=UPI000F07F80B|nr:HlyD family type I secretion periplasmic adaptor subunit [Arcobacter peruensis]